MSCQIELKQVEALPTAVIRACVAPRELSRFVPAACGEVWTFLRGPGLPKPGRNLAVYLDAKRSIECGVEVSAPFTGNERILTGASWELYCHWQEEWNSDSSKIRTDVLYLVQTDQS
jgi:hypothetical protein